MHLAVVGDGKTFARLFDCYFSNLAIVPPHEELRTLFELNQKLVSKLGGSEQYPPCLDPDWFNLNWVSVYKIQAKQMCDKLDSKYPRWVFNDPLTNITAGFWHDIMPAAKFVSIVTHPFLDLGSTESCDSMERTARAAKWHYNHLNVLKSVDRDKLTTINFDRFLISDEYRGQSLVV
jgi:hypothetical protein